MNETPAYITATTLPSTKQADPNAGDPTYEDLGLEWFAMCLEDTAAYLASKGGER